MHIPGQKLLSMAANKRQQINRATVLTGSSEPIDSYRFCSWGVWDYLFGHIVFHHDFCDIKMDLTYRSQPRQDITKQEIKDEDFVQPVGRNSFTLTFRRLEILSIFPVPIQSPAGG